MSPDPLFGTITSFRGPYRFLSNFYPAYVSGYWQDGQYPSVEHAYQAAKTTSKTRREAIRNAATAAHAKRLGPVRHLCRPNWFKN